MAPAKKATRKATKKATKRPGTRKMTAAHKSALAEGRQMSAAVDRYLTALHTPKQRGRKVSPAALQQRLSSAQSRLRAATGIDKVLAAQTVRDVRARIDVARSGSTTDIKGLERAFVKVAKKFGAKRAIGYGAWRDAGVPADVLKRAGIARTRG
jgi:hypothetical protein